MRIARVIVVVACLAGIAASLVAYRSEGLVDDGLRAISFHEPAAATRKKLEGARLLNPDERIESFIAITYAQEKRVGRANAIMRKAVRAEPDNLGLWMVWTEIHDEAGQALAARRTYEHAQTLDSQLPR
jgi:Flp pilus assembly protein TadD